MSLRGLLGLRVLLQAAFPREFLLAILLSALILVPCALAQETTAGLQGTIKDSSGGVVAKAAVEVSSPSLIGVKKAETDSAGYYRFANLPSGTYTVTVTASGFRKYREPNVELEVGHLPTLNITLEVGALTEMIEVSANSVNVDVTQSKVQTNISSFELMNIPTQSLSYQSVIQFAPGARYEPLQSSNGSSNNGFQVNGASNSENSYLVEGQETAAMMSGASNSNVPIDFIQEVQVKTNGFEAEFGGALGGVVNVVQKSGSNDLHGSVFTYYRADRFDAGPNASLIKNPQYAANYFGNKRLDQPAEYYFPIKDHYRIIDPGFTLGGPIAKDRLWFFVSGAPDFNQTRRTVNFNYPGAVGPRTFNQNYYTYYALARLDFLATQKIRLHGSWQYAYQRGTGTSIPQADELHGQFNANSTNNPDNYNGGIGTVTPNVLYNVGADITITPSLVATTRYGYWAYTGTAQSRGLPSGIRYVYTDTNYNYSTGIPALATTKALDGTLLPSQFVNSAGFSNIGANSSTVFDWWRRHNFSQDLAYFKNWHGTHNLKFGYGFMHGTADELAGVYNTADVYVAYNQQYVPNSQIGIANCKAIVAQNQSKYGVPGGVADGSGCQGLWGTLNLRDLISASGKVGGWNHSLYIQDAWTIGRRLTLNVGLRLDKEYLPSYNSLPGFNGISFGWGDKLAPRLGASYDLLGRGKVKVFASYGAFFDIMKYNLPQGSFGGAYWHDCVYALDSPDYTQIIPKRDSQGHYCPLGGGATPAAGSIPNARFIENYDYREPANDPNQIGTLGKTGLIDTKLKPMKQHVVVIGAAWEISPHLIFEPVYTRSRLDRTIEDAGVITPDGEVYYIVNPGFGVNTQVPSCSACPPNPKAIRNYDGIEFRLTKRFAQQWFGSFSYTYSRLYGNYSGLTSTDISDSIGRNNPNSERAFDEPFMSFDSHGNVITNQGPLATDRPHTVKAGVFYNPRWKSFNPSLGWFQAIYSGTPLSTYMSVWAAPVFVEGRGKFVNVSRDPTTGNWTMGSVSNARTPHFAQSDISLFQDFHISKTNERLVARVGADCLNCFNQHHPTVFNQNLLRTGSIQPYKCGSAGVTCTGVTDKNAGFSYASVLKGYDYTSLANSAGSILNTLYGLPYQWQPPRSMRFQVRFTF